MLAGGERASKSEAPGWYVKYEAAKEERCGDKVCPGEGEDRGRALGLDPFDVRFATGGSTIDVRRLR